MTNKYVCKRCRSENIIKKGVVNGKQRFQCKECKATFYGTKENLLKSKRKQETKEQSEFDFTKMLEARQKELKAMIDYSHTSK